MIKMCQLFSGVGCTEQALKNIGIDHISTQCEIDKYAIDTYNQLHGQTPNLGDISKINPNDLYEGQWDLITYSFPCQSISLAGKQEGLAKGTGTESSLLWECEKIIRKVKPKWLLMENVKNLLSEKFKPQFDIWLKLLTEMGYKNYYQVLNSKDFLIPQNRERVFCVSILGDDNYFEFPQKQPLKLRLKDMLEDSVDEKYYIKKELTDKFVKDLKNKQVSNSLRVGGKGSIDQKHAYDLVAVSCAMRGRYNENGKVEQQIELNSEQTANCITTAQKDSMIIQVGNLYETKNRDNPQRGRVYEAQGISPALNTCQGGGLQPHIIIDQKVKNSVAKNFEKEKDAIANSKKEIYQAKCESGFQDNKIGLKVSPTIRANNSDTFALDNNFRIRKLTVRECWRLMGWKDEQFDKIKGISNAQLYKQAGNGIVVTVLEAIFRQMFLVKYDKKPQQTATEQLELF